VSQRDPSYSAFYFLANLGGGMQRFVADRVLDVGGVIEDVASTAVEEFHVRVCQENAFEHVVLPLQEAAVEL